MHRLAQIAFIAAALTVSGLVPTEAAGQTAPRPRARQVNLDSIIPLEGVNVSVDRSAIEVLTPTQRLTLPVTTSVTVERALETVNLIDTQDALKYLPSLFIRKRNNGDTQATIATRTWGTSSGARSLLYADGVPLSALIANNNTIGSPRWGLVSPSEIARVDVMHGPFSAAYSGNSMGAVVEITTRMPDRLEGSVTQTQAFQKFSLYGTKKTYGTMQTAANVGSRLGDFSFWLNANHMDSNSQPVTYVTAPTFPANTTGGFPERNKLGAPANILGATGLLHTQMTNFTAHLSYDITPKLRASYRSGFWWSDTDSGVESYLQGAGTPTFAGQAGFASGQYETDALHNAQALSLRTDTQGRWDWELVATRYNYGKEQQRLPVSASATGTTFGTAGRVSVLDGTGWWTLDGRGTLRIGEDEASNAHAITVGVHQDEYRMKNPTYNTADWTTDEPVLGTIFTLGQGKTRTRALWAQDVWRIVESTTLRVGVRWEGWEALDGKNQNGAVVVDQPTVDGSQFSPKAVLTWAAPAHWTVSASLGKAYRFPTASELYQLVATGTTFTSPKPDLRPDNVTASEIRVEGIYNRASVQLSLFQDDVHDAIISQFQPLVPGSSTLYSYLSNVDHVRSRGVEFQLIANEILPGLSATGSFTLLRAKTLAITGGASATAPASTIIGKRLPNIPDKRGSLVATYKPIDRLSISFGGRYSDKVWTTLDNTDVNYNTYQGFSSWLVADGRANLRVNENLTASFGVDNAFDKKYFLFHPFPQRTFVVEAKASF